MSTIDLYALLGVARDASSADIRTAWSEAVKDLGPTDPTFNAFNQAGAVLLDDKRRAAYDAELAAAEDEVAETVDPAEGASAAAADVPIAADDEPAPPASPRTEPAPTASVETSAGGPSTVLLALVALLAVAAVLAAIFAAGPLGRALPDRGVPSDQKRLAAAEKAAEAAAVPVLAYDYRHLAADKKAATAVMTKKFGADYAKTFALIEQEAPAKEAVVTVTVVASAITGSDDDTVDVLLFVNRPTSRKGAAEPEIYRDQATFTMRRVEGEWLVDDIQTRRPA